MSNEVQLLKDQIKALKAEIKELKDNKAPKAAAGNEIVFIKSESVPAVKKNGLKYITVDITGTDEDGNDLHIRQDVLCDHQVEVPKPVAEALKGVMEAQKNIQQPLGML